MPSIASNYARVAKQVALLAERYAHAKKVQTREPRV